MQLEKMVALLIKINIVQVMDIFPTKKDILSAVDLYSPLRKYVLDHQLKSQDLFLYNDPCHFSTEGHKIIADIMFAEINKRGLLSSN